MHDIIKKASIIIVPLLVMFAVSWAVSYLIENKKDIFTTRPAVTASKKDEKQDVQEPVMKKAPTVVIEASAVKAAPSSIPAVVVDPSHGGDDPGFIGHNGAVESQANLQFAFMLARELRMRGIRVYLTRTEDKNLPVEKRISYVNEIKPLLYISINCAYSDIRTIKGMELFAFTPEQKGDEIELLENSFYEAYEGRYLPKTEDAMALEQRVSREIKKSLDLPYRSTLERKFFKNMAIAPSTAGLSLFIAYISSPDDIKKLSNPKYMDKKAEAVAEAVEKGLSLRVE